MWANILFPTHFLIGSYANQLPYFSRFFYFEIITSFIIWTEFKRAAHQSKFGNKKKQFAKGNLYTNRKITATVFDKLDISNEEDTCHQLHFFLLQTEPKQRASSPREILSHRLIEFPVVCSLTICDERGTALTFHNLALFSIYGNDGTTISTSGVILNKIISLRKGSRIKPVVGH